MTERRRASYRRRYHDHLKGGAGLAILLGAILVIGFDASRHGSDSIRMATESLDAMAGNSHVSKDPSGPGPLDRPMTRASLLPGEIVIETTGKTPAGQWRLGTRPLTAPPVILDSVAAGSHDLSLVEGDSVRWNVRIDLAPGGIAHVVVPSLDSSTTRPPTSPADSVFR